MHPFCAKTLCLSLFFFPCFAAQASEWSSATLAALNQPTSTTSGFINADGSAAQTSGAGGKHVGGTSGGGVDPASRVVKATPFAADFNAGMGGLHASGGLPPQQPQAQGLVTGGGLATSSNVPAHGSTAGTTAGATRAGLTRMESDALRAAGHDVPTSATGLSGWEQAEAQLRQLGIRGKPEAISSATLTPGQEVPGGWGATAVGEHPTTSLYDDVSSALDRVGHAAYAAVPQGLKDVIAGRDQPGANKVATPAPAGQPHSTAPDVLRQAQATAASLAAQAQSAAELAAQRAHQAFEEAKRGIVHNSGTGPLAGGAVTEATNTVPVVGATSAGGVAIGAAAQGASAGLPITTTTTATTTTGAASTSTSLPTDEVAGQKPGEHTEGAGKLPGGVNETGVAVLPDEKKASSSSSSGAAGVASAIGLGAGALASSTPTSTTDKSRDVGAVTRVGESSSGLPSYDGPAGGDLAPPLGVFNEATPLPTQTSSSIPQGVTAAMPQQPVAKVADVVVPESSAATIPTTSATTTSASASPSTTTFSDAAARRSSADTASAAGVTPPANTRLDSSISTTAIRAGQPGDLHGSKGISASSTQTSLPTIGESGKGKSPPLQVTPR